MSEHTADNDAAEQYGVQVLFNADSPSAHWRFHEDYPLSDSEDDARRYLADALDYGYAAEHLRVVAIRPIPPAEKDATADLLALVKTHRPNYVTEGVWDADPARSTQYTRVKCDGDGCDFYAQDPSWYGALDRHSAHLAEVLAARVTPPAATGDER